MGEVLPNGTELYAVLCECKNRSSTYVIAFWVCATKGKANNCYSVADMCVELSLMNMLKEVQLSLILKANWRNTQFEYMSWWVAGWMDWDLWAGLEIRTGEQELCGSCWNSSTNHWIPKPMIKTTKAFYFRVCYSPHCLLCGLHKRDSEG